MSITRAYIGLGSNLADPLAQVQRAVQEMAALPDCHLVACSPWYSSVAVGPGKQPDYVNGVACMETRLLPESLLDALQAIEQAHDRERLEHWGPRTLDLDILLYGDAIINTARLQVPHPWLQHRNFVLLPLADLAPELIMPDGITLQELLRTTSRTGIKRLSELEPQ